MAEGNTWESKENLKNAVDFMQELEEEYESDNWEVRQQERVEENKDYWRGIFCGQYTTKKLFG